MGSSKDLGLNLMIIIYHLLRSKLLRSKLLRKNAIKEFLFISRNGSNQMTIMNKTLKI